MGQDGDHGAGAREARPFGRDTARVGTSAALWPADHSSESTRQPVPSDSNLQAPSECFLLVFAIRLCRNMNVTLHVC